MADFAQQTTGDAAAVVRRARKLRDAGDRQAAIAALEELCRSDPSSKLGWAELSFHRLIERDNARALADAQEALRLDPEHLDVLINAGAAAHRLRDLRLARHYFERAVHIDRFAPDVQLRLGLTLAGLGEVAEAVNAYVRALGQDVRERPDIAWVIEQAAAGLAAIDPVQPVDGPLGALHEGTRWFVAGKLAQAYQCLERVREGSCGLGMPAIREAAETLLDEVWRRHARMTPTPNDAEHPCAPLLHLRP